MGDHRVGKTCLIENYLTNEFLEAVFPPDVFVYSGQKEVGGTSVDLEIHDASGDSGEERLVDKRKRAYRDADCFVICVAADKRQSYDNVRKWKDEIQTIVSDKPIVLVLTKSDSDETQDDLVALPMLRKKSREEGLQGAMQTSAKDFYDLNVQIAFERILATAYAWKYNE